ncbi:MAG TPA: hypothetical protein VF166_11355 [Gemmatimonadaceae bacterium]
MHIMRSWIGVAAAAAALGACASAGHHGKSASSGEVTAASEEVPVRVSNHNWSDVVVYALHSGVRYRLGDVSSMSTRVLTIPKGVISSIDGVQLVADPIGSEDSYTTEPIMTEPGDAIAFDVENQLAISSYSVGQRGVVLSRRPTTPQ